MELRFNTRSVRLSSLCFLRPGPSQRRPAWVWSGARSSPAVQACIQTRGLCPTLRRPTETERNQSDSGDSGGARGGAASRLDSAPPTGLPTRLWVLVETRAHPTALPGERRQCWRHALGGGSTFPAGLGVNVVVLALLWRPDCLLQGVAHIRWRHGLGGSRARGSTTFLAGLRMNIVLALRPVFLRESPTHGTCQPTTDQPTRSHSTLPKLRRDVMPFTAATSKPGMGKHPQHPASSP